MALICGVGYSQESKFISESVPTPKTAFGSQFYSFYDIDILGINYKCVCIILFQKICFYKE